MDNLDNIAEHSSEGVSGHAMAENLQLRLRAEKRYLELQANAKIMAEFTLYSYTVYGPREGDCKILQRLWPNFGLICSCLCLFYMFD